MGLFGDVGGVIGSLMGAGDKKAGMEQQLQNYKMGLDYLKNTKEEAGNSAIENVAMNPALQAAQMSALGALQGEAASGGMTAQDRATQQQSMDAIAQQERGQREAIMQNQAARNTGGGGAGLAAQLAAQQGAAQRNSMAGTQQVADSRQRALQAMAGAGGLAGNIRGQSFGEQSNIAQAKDLINQFNAGQRLKKSTGVQGAYTGLGDIYNTQGKEKAADTAALGAGIGGIAGGLTKFIPGMQMLPF
jgi:hypothetical protein